MLVKRKGLFLTGISNGALVKGINTQRPKSVCSEEWCVNEENVQKSSKLMIVRKCLETGNVRGIRYVCTL